MFALSIMSQQGQETPVMVRASLRQALCEHRGAGKEDFLLIILVAIKGWQSPPAVIASLFLPPQSFCTIKLIFAGWHTTWEHKAVYR